MSMQAQIEAKISANFSGDFLEVFNESHMHAGPATESHFKLILVSEQFNGLGKVKRHQMIYKILAEEMTKIHALALHLYTNDEWIEQGNAAPASPECAGVRV